jgi:NAD(P)-dependent dehydrogenase (short-subunit alcohol dehydrogenase family)
MIKKPTDAVDLTCRLAGEVAIVTGGSQGIGQAVASRLAAEGAAVAILARTAQNVSRATDELLARGAQAMGVPCDVTDRAQVHSAVEQVVSKFGRVTVLINHAGLFKHAPFVDMTDEMWDEIIRVNLTGMFIVGQEVARQMVAQGLGGRIVNMSSVAGRIAHSDQTAYGVTKAGIESMTRSMAMDLAPYGIIVNAVAPGTIETPFSVGNLSEEAVAKRVGRIPLGRLGLPEEVAAVIAMLASRDAAYVTGAVLAIDGGLTVGGIRAQAKPQ